MIRRRAAILVMASVLAGVAGGGGAEGDVEARGAAEVRIRSLPRAGSAERAAGSEEPKLKRWMAERRQLHAWLTALRREVEDLRRRADLLEDGAEKRWTLSRMRERMNDMEAVRGRLLELKRRLSGGPF